MEQHRSTMQKVTGELTESRRWCKNLAQQYAETVDDVTTATIEDSYTWLEGLAERITDPKERQRVLDLTHREGRDYLVWAKQQINQRLVSVRGLSHVLYTEARAQAIKENKNIGQWINEAINEKLHNTTSN